MRKFLYHIALLVLLCTGSYRAYTQQVQFSQYYSASLHLNPAIAGIYLTPSFHASYRRQNSLSENSSGSEGFTNELSQASLILPVKKKNSLGMPDGGVGLLVYSNSAGPGGGIKTNGLMVNYAHNLQIGNIRARETVILSAQVGMEQMRLDQGELRWGSQYNPFIRGGYDPTRPVTFLDNFEQSPGYMVINLGAMYYWNIERNFFTYRYSAFSGISVNNVNRPSTSFILEDEESQLDILYKYHGGFEFRFKSFDFLPTILGTLENGIFRFNAGGTIAYDLRESKQRIVKNNGMKLAFGVWYKLRDSFIFYGGFRSATFNLGISYDMSTTEFISGNFIDFGPATEISLQYFLKPKKGKDKSSGNPLF